MDFLSQTYIALRGPTGAPQTALETVRRLADRLSQDTLLSDRRAAVLSLKGLSRDCKADVGETALHGLLEVLEKDSDIDGDIGKAVLETLVTLCEVANGEGHGDAGGGSAGGKDVGMKHTDMVLETPKAANKLFHLLGDQTFYTRYGTLQLLQVLLQNRRTIVQGYFIKSSVGFSNVISILEEKREIVRNEGLLMVQSLISQNAEIQKILAFEGAFEKLLNIVTSEGGVEGGIVVQDSLTNIDGLLRFNVSNQSYFRETSLLPHLTPLLLFPSTLPPTAPTPQEFALQFWDPQKSVNAGLVVGIIGMLISGKGGVQYSILRCLLELALASNAPTAVKSQALRTLPPIPGFSTAIVTPYQPVPETNGEEWDRLEPITALDALVNNTLEGEYGGINDSVGTGKRDALEFRALSLGVFENFTKQEEVRLNVIQGMLPVESTSGSRSPSIASLNLLSALTIPPTSPLTVPNSNRIHLATLLFSSLIRISSSVKALAQAVVPSLAVQPPPTPSVGGTFFVPADGTGVSEHPQPGEEDIDNDDRPQTLLQTLAEHLSLSFLSRVRAIEKSDGREEREWDRLIVGYLSLLAQWLWENPSAVREFLEAGGLSVLVEPINQTSGMDVLVQGMCAFLLAVCYEFNREPGEITRHTIHAILNRLSSDALVARMARVREDERFKSIGPDTLVLAYPVSQPGALNPLIANGFGKEDEGIEIWFDWGFIEFWKSNFYTMQRAVNTEPDAVSASTGEFNLETATLITSLNEQLQMQKEEMERLQKQILEITHAHEEEKILLMGQIATAKADLENTQGAKKEADKEQEDLLVFLEELSGKRRRDKARMREAGLEVSDDEGEEEDE
ncbi:hypothetical protein K439DRAFT_1334276 [Ramaria rubella]|nr:hypothetical protein K439DRAFT_1334276 [Ramaria rubella]